MSEEDSGSKGSVVEEAQEIIFTNYRTRISKPFIYSMTSHATSGWVAKSTHTRLLTGKVTLRPTIELYMQKSRLKPKQNCNAVSRSFHTGLPINEKRISAFNAFVFFHMTGTYQ